MQITHAAGFLLCHSVLTSFFQFIKLHCEGKILLRNGDGCYRCGARKCAWTQVDHWWQFREGRWQEEKMRTHTQWRWYPDQSGWSQGGQTDLVGQKCSETPPFKCLLRWKCRSASGDILWEVSRDRVRLLSSASSALIASTPLHF